MLTNWEKNLHAGTEGRRESKKLYAFHALTWHIRVISHAVLEDHTSDMLFQQYKAAVHACTELPHTKIGRGGRTTWPPPVSPDMTPFVMEQNWHRWPYYLPTVVSLTLYHFAFTCWRIWAAATKVTPATPRNLQNELDHSYIMCWATHIYPPEHLFSGRQNLSHIIHFITC
jgi:hypothetical protein